MMTSWKFTMSRATTLALMVALCLGLMQFVTVMAQTQQETITEPEPQDLTVGTYAHQIHISFCVS